MELDERNFFTLNGQVVYPARDGDRHGYVLACQPRDLFEWQDLRAVTQYARDKARMLVPPEFL